MSDENKVDYAEMRRAWEEMKSRVSAKDAETAEQKQAIERTNAAISAFESQVAEEKKAREALELKLARIEQLEAESKDAPSGPTAEEKAFQKFVRKGEGALTEGELKALATDNDTEGGYMVPAPMEGRFIEKLIEFSPVRAEVTVETISQGNAWVAPAEGSQNFAAGKVGERDSRPETTAGKLRLERIPVHEFYANPFVTQTMVDDAGFDLDGWIARRVGTRRAVLEGGYYINGTGEGEPEGLLTNADITGVNGGATATLTPAGLMELIFDLPAPYARNAVFLWHRTTTLAVRQMRSDSGAGAGTGDFLWAPGLNGGTQGTVLGHRYVECIDMPEVDADEEAILFGDFRAAYTIVDRKGLMLTRDPFSSKPFIEMYFTWRSGGQVVLAEAVRKLTVAS